jgi:hypothetical protein
MANINEKLLNLNFSDVDLYDFAMLLFEECEEQSLFEPLKTSVPEKFYSDLLKPWLPNYEELLPLVNQEFFEYMRIKVLEANGFELEDGYYESKTNVKNIHLYLNQ